MTERYIGGFHTVIAALESTTPPQEVLLSSSRRDARAGRVRELVEAAGVPLRVVPRDRLDLLLPGMRHQGVAAQLADTASSVDPDALLQVPPGPDGLLLVLDGVQDPHNLGACMRSAEAAGAQAVIIPRDRAAQMSPTVHKVSAGSAERLPLLPVTNLARTLERLRELGYWISGLAGEAGLPLWQADFRRPTALVLGAEGQGLRRLTREHCDLLLRIPMAGGAESLNVSVAAGVCLFEVARQRESV